MTEQEYLDYFGNLVIAKFIECLSFQKRFLYLKPSLYNEFKRAWDKRGLSNEDTVKLNDFVRRYGDEYVNKHFTKLRIL